MEASLGDNKPPQHVQHIHFDDLNSVGKASRYNNDNICYEIIRRLAKLFAVSGTLTDAQSESQSQVPAANGIS